MNTGSNADAGGGVRGQRGVGSSASAGGDVSAETGASAGRNISAETSATAGRNASAETGATAGRNVSAETGATARVGATRAASGATGNADSGELGKFDALASRFWDVGGEFRPLHLLNPVRARFVAERATLPGARVLDVGCGGGLLAEALTRAGAKVTAIDLAPGMIEVARLHAMEQKLEIDYRMVAAEAVAAAEPGGFDVVTCMEMLEHVPEPAQMVATLATLVRPGGAVFISTLNRNLKSFLLAIVGAEYVMKLIPRGTHEYDRLIRPAELARWARSAGLSLRELAGIELNPFTEHCSLSRDIAVNYLAHLER